MSDSATLESAHPWTDDVEILSGKPSEEENTMDDEDNFFAAASCAKEGARGHVKHQMTKTVVVEADRHP